VFVDGKYGKKLIFIDLIFSQYMYMLFSIEVIVAFITLHTVLWSLFVTLCSEESFV